MKNSNISSQKYFEVEAKCGHVGRKSCVWIKFAVAAENGKDAAKRARAFPRVKHHHPDAIKSVTEIDFAAFKVLKAENDADPYLHCKNRREQDLIVDFWDRVEDDEYNLTKYEKEITRNAGFKLKKNRFEELEAVRTIREYLFYPVVYTA